MRDVKNFRGGKMNYFKKRRAEKERKKKEKAKKNIKITRNSIGAVMTFLGILMVFSETPLFGLSFALLGISINTYFWTVLEKTGLKPNKIVKAVVYSLLVVLLVLFTPKNETSNINDNTSPDSSLVADSDKSDVEDNGTNNQESSNTTNNQEVNENTADDPRFEGYKLVTINACNLDGGRMANVVVDIGYGDREYWAFTNEYGQLVRVIADEIIPQDDYNEDVNSDGRYCADEAKVPGVESSDLDEGHVIADSLGGVSNAYNITPQNSAMNRYGDQAYMEKVIRDAGGATNFEAIITYPDHETMIPSHYKYTYTIKGNTVTDEFDNVDPATTINDTSSSNSNKGGSSSNQSSSNSNKNNSSSSSSSSSNNSSSSNSSAVTNNNTDKTTEKVWISETGSKYHSIPNCGRMNPDKATQISLKDAEAMGYEPCSKCH